MKYDFDKQVNRRGTGSLKWDVPENELPMWVADMDFETVPQVKEALGLTNMVEDDTIRDIVLSNAPVEERAKMLVSTANRNGGRDNITVMIIEPFSYEVKAC